MRPHIDTLEVYEKLISSGVPDLQAKAQVHAMNESLFGLATKEDLENGLEHLEKDFKKDISQLGEGLRKDINHIATIIYMFGGAFFVVMILPTIERYVKIFFPKYFLS